MGKKGERGAKDKSAAQEEEARIAARRAEHGEEEYVCSGALELDFPELCARAGLQEAPRVVSRPHPPAGGPPEEPEGAGGAWPAGEQREALSALAQIQAKYAYFRPAVQVELEHEDPKSAREVFIRSWKIEEKMLGVLAKCLPALAHLQALHLWKVGLTDPAFLSLLPVLAACANLKTLVLEGNPLPERSFYKLVSEESSLAHLSLRNNCMDDQAVLLIGQSLSSLRSSNKNLVSINLSYNHITDVGATHLANGLRLNRSLLSLSLAHNQIGDEGALKLAEVLGPFALTHTEVVERRRLLLEKEAQERGRLPQRHSELKGDRPASHVSSTTIDKLQTAKGSKAVIKKKEPTKKEEKGPVGGAAPAQPPAAPAAQAKKEDAKQSKKAVPPVDPKAKGAKGVKLGSKDKRSQILEVETVSPTQNPKGLWGRGGQPYPSSPNYCTCLACPPAPPAADPGAHRDDEPPAGTSRAPRGAGFPSGKPRSDLPEPHAQPHLGERLEGLPGHGGVPGQPDHSWGQGANRPPASLSGEKPVPGREQDLQQDPGAHGAPRPPPQSHQAGGGAAHRCPVSQGQLLPEDAAPRSSEPNLLGRIPRTGTGGQRSPPPHLKAVLTRLDGRSPPFRPLKATRETLNFFFCVKNSMWGKKPVKGWWDHLSAFQLKGLPVG